jgi:hypothetical protein
VAGAEAAGVSTEAPDPRRCRSPDPGDPAPAAVGSFLMPKRDVTSEIVHNSKIKGLSGLFKHEHKPGLWTRIHKRLIRILRLRIFALKNLKKCSELEIRVKLFFNVQKQ